jgi:hypothetical protein
MLDFSSPQSPEYVVRWITMQGRDVRSSACAGEFILIGLSADTMHCGTTMFDRHPAQRPR